VIACSAIKEWGLWVASNTNHEALLTNYTDGTPSEPWCADFVSYVYKEAGFPFTGGSADGWDQNDANAVQYMGFTMHPADGSYQPKPGDVAFFSYPGGHVEIVVSGGSKPTFVYGDSAQIDPTTNNGQMKANTITSDSSGQLEYYLSLNA
jgi:cell wall-associated NlpC family hydrolase